MNKTLHKSILESEPTLRTIETLLTFAKMKDKSIEELYDFNMELVDGLKIEEVDVIFGFATSHEFRQREKGYFPLIHFMYVLMKEEEEYNHSVLDKLAMAAGYFG